MSRHKIYLMNRVFGLTLITSTKNPLKTLGPNASLALSLFRRASAFHSRLFQAILEFVVGRRMISASLRGRYDSDVSGAIGTVTVDGGAVKLKANMTDATFVNGPSLEGLSLSLEKPGSFLIDYDVPKKVQHFSPTFSVSICLPILVYPKSIKLIFSKFADLKFR